MIWLAVAAVVLVAAGLVWWSSGRSTRGVDADAARRSKAITESEVAPHSQGNLPGGHGIGGF
jgi:hypothetical protein